MLRPVFLLWAILAVIPPVALADIKTEDVQAYNSAVESGDPASILAAATRLGEAAVASPEHPQASLLAYEAGWMLCRIGACASAVQMARFAEERADGPPMSALLSAYAAWTARPDRKSSKAVDAALAEIETGPPTGISVSVFRELYSAKINAGEWAEAGRIAGRAASHFASEDGVFDQFKTEAQLINISSVFNTAPHIDHMRDMLHLQGQVERMRALTEDTPEWMDDTYWTTVAWVGAMDAYFKSIDRRSVSDTERQMIRDDYMAGVRSRVDHEEINKAPFCEGRLNQKPTLKYPTSAAFRGRIGAVVVKFKFRDGRVFEPEVLASVPLDGFRDSVVKTVSQWTFVPDEDPGDTGCSLDHDNVVQVFQFAIR